MLYMQRNPACFAILSHALYSFTMKEHALVVVVVILICNFLLSVCVSFPQLLIHNLLNLQSDKGEEGKKETRLKIGHNLIYAQ